MGFILGIAEPLVAHADTTGEADAPSTIRTLR
jgi:hypothetical protein